MLWSIGKDSNALLWLARKAFFGRVPFPVTLLETGKEFPEVYALRDRLIAEWRLDYIDAACPPIVGETDASLPPDARAAARKTLGLSRLIASKAFAASSLGIRRDEQADARQGARFQPARRPGGSGTCRDQPAEFWDHFNTDLPPGIHVRVHPLLALDRARRLALRRARAHAGVRALFRARRQALSARSAKATSPPRSTSTASSIEEIIAELETTRQAERAGRKMDHESEDAFERLRAAGYM